MRRELEEDEVEDRPRRKKKKKQKQEKNWIPYLIIGGGAACVLMLLIGLTVIIIVWSRSGDTKLATPVAYETFNCPEDVFHVDLPQAWKLEAGGKKGTFYVEARKGTVYIKVNENVTGSLIGDIVGQRSDPNGADENLPVSRVHDFKLKAFEADYGKYQEEPAVTIRNGFGKTRRSTFTGIEGLRKIRGYRSTSLGAMTQITVTCTAPLGDWDTVEPAFAKAIETLGSGRKGP